MDIYQAAIRPFLFSGLKTDPERLHQQTLALLSWLQQQRNRPPARWMLAAIEQICSDRYPNLEQTLWGLRFPNPLGLAAGFDKDGVAAEIWDKFGFGFAEIGTVTAYAQSGNPRPRLFRLTRDLAVLNRMGFNNQGSAALAERLASSDRSPIPLGINLGKSKITPLEDAARDYQTSFRRLQTWGDYFVVNVSSPNTPGLRSLQNAKELQLILAAIADENRDAKPLLVKIAPDLSGEALSEVVEIAKTYQLAGIIATNTTIDRDGLKTRHLAATGKPLSEEPGGISGQPLGDRSTEVIRTIWQQTQGSLPIIGVGGIFTPQDAWEKLTAGATLLQVYTGWIYEGPLMVRRVLKGVSDRLTRGGYDSLAAIRGQNIPWD